MPRNGSGVYSAPANTAAVSGEVIASDKYNTLVADLVADANAARPISAGGTGATSVAAARATLSIPFQTITEAAAASIPGDVDALIVGGVKFARTSTTYRLGGAAGGDQFTSADGAKWVRADLIETNMRQPIVLLGGGQSNALGVSSGNGGVIDSEPGVWCFERFTSGDQTQGWKTGFKKSPDYITGQTGNHFIYHFAARLHRETGRPVCVLFDAIGGQDVAAWLPSRGGAPAVSGAVDMWGRLSQLRTAAFAAALPFRTDGATLSDLGLTTADYVLWHQGEGNSDASAVYGGDEALNFKRDLVRVMSLFLNPASFGSGESPIIRADTPFVLGELWIGGASDDRNAELHQAAAEIENVRLARIGSLKAADSLHFDPEEHERMADRYYDAIHAAPPLSWEVTIPDDGLYEFRPSHIAGQYGIVDTGGTSRLHISFGYRIFSPGQITPLWDQATATAVQIFDDVDLSTLAATTDGQLGISATGGKIQIRNRRAGSLTIRIIPQTPQPLPGYLTALS